MQESEPQQQQQTSAPDEDLTKAEQAQDARPAVFDNTLDATPGAILKERCIGLALRTSSFSTSKGFDSATKDEIAEATGMSREAVSGGKRLFDAKHEAIKRANAALGAVQSYWQNRTLPLATSYPGGEGKMAGVRLVEVDKYQQIDEHLVALAAEVKAAQDHLNAERDSIIEASRQLLGEKFDERDFPRTFKLEVYWYPMSVEPPSYLERVAPEAYERAQRMLQDQLERSAEEAIGDFVQEFLAVTRRWTQALGPVVRIYPDRGHPWHQFSGAEILERTTSVEDPEVPEGRIRVKLRIGVSKDEKDGYVKLDRVGAVFDQLLADGHIDPETRESVRDSVTWLQGQAKRKTSQVDFTPQLLTTAQYQQLNPQEQPQERRTFRDTTIEALQNQVQQFRDLAGVMSAGPELRELVDRAAQQITGFQNAAEAAQELRDSRRFRQQTHEVMQQLSGQLEQQVETVTQARSKRRQILRGVA